MIISDTPDASLNCVHPTINDKVTKVLNHVIWRLLDWKDVYSSFLASFVLLWGIGHRELR
jgi:hypothetical protein